MAAESYALPTSLVAFEVKQGLGHVTSVIAFSSPEETIWKVPVSALGNNNTQSLFTTEDSGWSTDLQRFEHVGEWCQSYQEMANNHGRREMCAVMKWFLFDTLKVDVTCYRSFTSCWC